VKPGLYDELRWRGLIQDETDGLRERLDEGPITVYCGYDPTAPSLHAGNLQQIVVFRHFQRYGHQVIALAGGGTGLIGDPSGKSAERPLVDADTIRGWTENVRSQIERIVEPGAVFHNNLDWLEPLRMVEFLRDVGKHFPMGYMLAKESVRTRVSGEGMSYTEFSYMLLQAYDFVRLYEDHGCRMQFGGSDQWGNITAGLELLRRTGHEGAYGMTVPLLLRADGTKFGKTEEGAVWLDRERTSPYAFYQFFLNTPDDQVPTLLRRLTLLAREEIEELEGAAAEAPQERRAQRALAAHLTELVHGPEGLREAEAATAYLFGDARALDDFDVGAALRGVLTTVSGTDLDSWPKLAVAAGAAASMGEARRLISGGGLYAGERKIGADDDAPTAAEFDRGVLVLRKGRRNRFPVELVD
jgi:tyrosyl-tRNA synthetase